MIRPSTTRPSLTRLAGILALPVLMLLAPSAASAQAAVTGTGGGPASTIYAPNTSSVGQTMPPTGAAGAATAGANREARTAEQKEADKITRGICIGCGPK